ncbi:MAG: 2Fe-2S iron-sulfur cluster binding domain-containing protein [Chloroflexi bacterium]|nr:2Fe-2S iron-sulfur cluster binding domain-containing protein [Chloroflexota bacterium]
MITFKIDGREFKAEKGQTILQVARENGIDIPTLCHHEAIEPYGACRLCIVEISRGGRSRIVTSCLYPVEEGLEVKTGSPRVISNRKMILELLLARCSKNSVIRELASHMGVEQPSFKSEYLEDNDCIVCGLCVRACEQVVGVSAISLVNRGITKEPASPFLESALACIGCGSCYYICPTGAIKMEDRGDIRIIHNWKVEFKLKKCRVCGDYWAPEKQLEYIRTKWGLPEDFFDICPTCK